MSSDPLHRGPRRCPGLPRCPHHLRRSSPGYGQSVGSQIQLQHDRRVASGHHQAVRSLFHHPLDAVSRASRSAPNFSRSAGHGRSQTVRCAALGQRRTTSDPARHASKTAEVLIEAIKGIVGDSPQLAALFDWEGWVLAVHWAHCFVDSGLGGGRRHGRKSQRSRKDTVQAGDRGGGREQRRNRPIPSRE